MVAFVSSCAFHVHLCILNQAHLLLLLLVCVAVDESTLEKDIYSAPRVQVDDVPQGGGGGDTQKLSPPSSPMVCASPAPALGVDALLDWAQQLDLDSGAFDDF